MVSLNAHRHIISTLTRLWKLSHSPSTSALRALPTCFPFSQATLCLTNSVQCIFISMRPIPFVKPNVSTLTRADRIAEETWERYRTDIIREYVSGGSTGNAHAIRWIKQQEIPGFDPKLVLQFPVARLSILDKNFRLKLLQPQTASAWNKRGLEGTRCN